MNRPICREPDNFGGVVRVAAALVITASCCVSNCSSCQAQSAAMMAHVTFHNRPARLIADYRTRALVRHICPDQVASLQFNDLLHGPVDLTIPTGDPSQVVVHPGFEPTVTDRRLISEFLHALRHAYKQEGAIVADAWPSLHLTFGRTGQSQRQPIDVDFNSAYLGPEFQSVLAKVPRYLATQLHRKMQTLDGQVREVDSAASKVTDTQKVAQIIRALKQVKQNAFSVCGQTTNTFGLRLRRGGSEEVVFVVDPPLMSRSGSSILPEPLYTDIAGGKGTKR